MTSLDAGPRIDLHRVVDNARRHTLRLGHAAGGTGAHYGPALSLIEVMAVLYDVARVSPASVADPDRDRVILSKGHGSLALYAVLHEYGFIDRDILDTAETDGTRLPGQPIRDLDLGIEYSSGSLGMGLSYGLGLEMSGRRLGSDRRVFVVMGDGETNEGSVWEAAMAAAHHGAGALTAVVDVNDLQSDGSTAEIMSCDHASVWRGFGWDVHEVDGHDLEALRGVLAERITGRPRCVLARTVKGKGISFMEGAAHWHHGRLTPDQLAQARAELGAADYGYA